MEDNGTTTAVQEPTNIVTPAVNPFADRAAAAAVSAEVKVLAKRGTSLLSTITTRKRRRPVFGVLFGPPGIGKSTFMTEAPNPIFIPVERGLDQLTVAKFPTPATFEEFYKQIDTLDTEDHDYQSVVIDTADALEILIHGRVCAEYKCKSIEDPGYGKGYARAKEIWVGVLNKLSKMSERFNVFLICHSHIKSINDPSLSGVYDCWELKLHAKAAEVIRQMVDTILFAQMEISIQKDTPKARKGRGILSDDRVLWTSPGTGYEAKNRFNLPNPLPFQWEALQTAINTFYGDK